jgi:hypothetical protein
MKSVMTILAMGLLIAGSTKAQAPVEIGDQFQINSYTTSYQWLPSVAVDAQGDFVVVWASDGSYDADSSAYSVQGQRYDANGASVGDQFQINSYTTNVQSEPAASVDAQGNFVVVWRSRGSSDTDSSGYSIQAQRYDADGAPEEVQFQVNTYTTSSQWQPSVSADPQGNFVVVWSSYGSLDTDTSAYSVQGQLYDTTGALVGGQFQVNTYTTNIQYQAAVASDTQGNFVVVWRSFGSQGTDTLGSSIQGQRYDATGASVGGQFQVNSYTTSGQLEPTVAADAQGNFIVAWTSFGSQGTDTLESSIQGQRYDATGASVGGQFQVNSYTTSGQWQPSVSTDAQGNFVVAWHSSGSSGTDTDGQSVQGRLFGANGTPLGDEFQVNSYTTSEQRAAAIAANARGDFVVAWQSYGSYGTDDDNFGIEGQRYHIPQIFADGFESGDTTAWSSTVQ